MSRNGVNTLSCERVGTRSPEMVRILDSNIPLLPSSIDENTAQNYLFVRKLAPGSLVQIHRVPTFTLPTRKTESRRALGGMSIFTLLTPNAYGQHLAPQKCSLDEDSS